MEGRKNVGALRDAMDCQVLSAYGRKMEGNVFGE